MATVSQLPCDGDGICMTCKKKPSPDDNLACRTCATPWHFTCLPSSAHPQTLADALCWDCPDCSPKDHPYLPPPPPPPPSIAGKTGSADELVLAIRAIESDDSLTELDKARRRQELVSSGGARSSDEDVENVANKERINGDNNVLAILDGNICCSICMQLPERPVTTPCGHNFCLKCFQKWVAQGKRTCANCRNQIPSTMASQPRINSALVIAIRMAKMQKPNVTGGAPKVYHFVHNQNRPDKAYTTERARKPGKANACSGKIFVTIPPDHFGPILAENDPQRKQGVLVGETWDDRMECRQWGAHLPHVAGISGQAKHGAQSVALSGGYIDDEDHGEWFLYTGSGGRDLSGNKRTNKAQSFDQKFEKLNEALRQSCRKGYPVRVVRSHKEKRSSYAPEAGVRYDGVYRIEKCWRKNGKHGYKVCRYLFVRCDNNPAPWTCDIHGDRPRPLPAIKELKNAVDITERKGSPSWDYDEVKSCWLWKKPPPCSRKQMEGGNIVEGNKGRRAKKILSARDKLLKEFKCQICWDVMTSPLTTPCAHNFCKACLEDVFAGQSFTRQRTCEGRRTLRAQKNIMKCPSCSNDIAEFLQNPQVNRELMTVLESLQVRNARKEQSDGYGKEANSMHEETINVAADTTEMLSANSQILEEAKHNNLKYGMEAEPPELDKSCKGKSSCERRSSLERPCVEKDERVCGSVKPQAAENRLQTAGAESKLKQSNKRKNSSNTAKGNSTTSNVGMTTRSKRAKLIAQ